MRIFSFILILWSQVSGAYDANMLLKYEPRGPRSAQTVIFVDSYREEGREILQLYAQDLFQQTYNYILIDPRRLLEGRHSLVGSQQWCVAVAGRNIVGIMHAGPCSDGTLSKRFLGTDDLIQLIDPK